MDSRVLDHNPETGITTYHHFDPITELSHLESVQDVSSLLDDNKAHANEGYKPGMEFRRVAQIPLVVYYDLKRRGILQDKVAFKRWLNDRDNRFFRTTHERV